LPQSGNYSVSKDFVPNTETQSKEQIVLDISLQSNSTLFNLLTPFPQETKNLYYNVGISSQTPSQNEMANAPHIESFERMMERIHNAPESSVVDRGASPYVDDAGVAEDNAELSGRIEKQNGDEKHTAVKQDAATTPLTEADEEKHDGEDFVMSEDASAWMLAREMINPAIEQSIGENPHVPANDLFREVPPEDASVMNGESGTGTEAVPPLDANPEYALSIEDGIMFTDTHPLFENKPDVINMNFDVLVDDASAPDLAAETEVWLADGKNTAGAAKQKGGTKDDLKDVLSDDGEIPEPFDIESNRDYLVSFTEKDAKTEPAANRKKADTRKLNLEVLDMRSSSASSVQGGAFTEADTAKSARIPVADMSLDIKGDLLTSIAGGDNRQTQAGFEQFRSTDMKSAAQLESFLSRELHNGLNGDIVRQASVMLRDGGEGLIRLQLHPESLGNVRIKLSMSGNRVEGVITVESPEALNAFERELESLEMAFRDSGFEGASLNMQMSGGNSGDSFDGVQAGAFSHVLAASNYDSSANVQNGETHSIYERGNLSILA
jgi:hypothetical protein